MSEGSWVLKGVDATIREKAAEEAARLGVSLSDYVADKVLQSALAEQLTASQPSAPEEKAIFAPPAESGEGFAVRQRLKALERRLSAAVSGLDGTVHGLDSSLFDLTARVGDVEALAGDTAQALGQTQQEISNAVNGLQVDLAVLEDNLSAFGEAQDARAEAVDARIDGVERSASVLADAHEALKHALADDFVEFSQNTAARLSAGLEDVRAAADEAAEQADAAVAHLVRELRAVREDLDQRLEDSVETTRARMHEAFADAAERMGVLAERVIDNEKFTTRVTEQLRAQIVDVEDGLQTAIEENASALRHADAALAADLVRSNQEHRAAQENARRALLGEMEDLREDQRTHAARLRLVDDGLAEAVGELGTLKANVEQSLVRTHSETRAALADANAVWSGRFDAAESRISYHEGVTQQMRQGLMAEIERVETCTFAALEKLSRDIAAGDDASQHRIALAAQNSQGELQALRDSIASDAAENRETQAGVQARLTLLDGALARVEAVAAPLSERLQQLESALNGVDPELEARLSQLEGAAAGAASEFAVSLVKDQVTELAARLNDSALADRVAELQAKLAQHESAAIETGETVQGVARMLNRVAAQSLESTARNEDRIHKVELAMADLRLETIAAADKAPAEAAVETLAQQISAFERMQADTLHTLRNDIARFIGDNDRRLSALESAPAATPDRDLAAEFEALRQRIEERIIGVEQRSIRTLEQVVDTVAMLEERFLSHGGDEAAARSA